MRVILRFNDGNKTVLEDVYSIESDYFILRFKVLHDRFKYKIVNYDIENVKNLIVENL